MFKHQLVPNINLFERIQPTKLDVGSGVDTMRLQRIEFLKLIPLLDNLEWEQF